MFSKMTIAIATLLVSTMAHADLMGTWTGDLAYSYDSQAAESCVAEISYAQADGMLTFNQGFSSGACEFTTEVTLMINGSELQMGDGTVVGSIAGDKISFALPTVDDVSYEASMTLNADGSAQFADKYIASGIEETLTGAMTKSR